jgi:hypothetical protein
MSLQSDLARWLAQDGRDYTLTKGPIHYDEWDELAGVLAAGVVERLGRMYQPAPQLFDQEAAG